MNLISTPKSRLSAPGDVWRTERRSAGDLGQLIEAGFETGHAYAKALRMRKPAWVAPGAAMALATASASRGTGKSLQRHPYTAQNEVRFSGCTRECSEAQGKDVGIIALKKAGTCMFAVTAA